MATARCNRCGAPLGPTAAGQICPACLIKAALDESELTLLTPAVSAGAGSPLLPPKRIGPYTILEQLGEGGMGVVYLAEQVTPIRRRVALKLIKLGMDTHQVVARFEVERQALALMDHPNIASVFDAGATEDGRPYFVMEYVPGVPITEFCDRQQLPTRARLELFQHVCAAVQHAHQKGVIHRDLKPSNVLVIDQDGQPTPKVIDFGIAKATGQHLTEKTLFTEHGILVGTPEYMSPEQADAGAGPVDTRTDIYSLGILLYELLVGNLPFTPTELRRAGYSEIQRIIREREAPKPSSKLSSLGLTGADVATRRRTSSSSLLREIRGDLDWITLKAIEKAPSRRYASASELSADIGRHLHFEPVLAGPPGATYRLKKFVRKHRGAVAACTSLVVLLTAGLAISTALYVRAERSKQEAERQRAVAEDQRSAAQAAEREADGQRNAAQNERVIAVSERATAEAERAAAVAQRDAALFQSYRNALLAADQNLLAREFGQARHRLEATDRRFRGWEWRYLSRAADSSLMATAVFAREVREVRFSRTGDAILARAHDDLPVSRSSLPLSPPSRGRAMLQPLRVTKSTVTKLSLRTGITTASHAFGERVISISPDGSRVLTAMWNMSDFFIDCQARTVQESGFVCQPVNPNPERQSTRPSLVSDERDRLVVRDTSSGQAVATLLQPNVGVWRTSRATSGNLVVIGPRVAGGNTAVRDDAGQLFATLSSQYPDVVGGTFSADGTRLASWSWDNVIHIWDLSTQSTLATLRGHGDGIRSVEFDPRGARVVSTSLDGTARLWSVADGAQLQALQVTAPSTAAFSLSGESIAVGTDSGLIQIAETSSGRVLTSLKVHSSTITSLTFSPDSSRVAFSATGDEIIRLWSVSSANQLAAFAGHDRPVTAVAFSPDGTLLASGARDGTVRVWNAQPALLSLPGPAISAGSTLGFIPSTRDIISMSSTDGKVRVWNPATGELLRILDLAAEGFYRSPYGVAMSVQPVRIAFPFNDPNGPPSPGTRILDISTGNSLMTVRPEPGEAAHIAQAISPDGKRLVVGSRIRNGSAIAAWNVPSTRPVALWKIEGSVLAMSCSDDRRRVAVVVALQPSTPLNRPGRLLILDVGRNAAVAAIELAQARPVHPVFSGDGSQVAFGDGSKVRLWNLGWKGKALDVGEHDRDVTVLSISPDGARLVTAGVEGTVRIWDLPRRELLLTIRTMLAYALSFSAEGDRLAVGSTRSIQILDGSPTRIIKVR